MTSKALSTSDVRTRLKKIPAWKKQQKTLVRTHKFPTYLAALKFVYKLGLQAEKHDHHPDINMKFREVTIRYSTHTAGGITALDFKMAGVVDDLIRG